jgi:uncharacterized membrane protein YheB (UPF0754 family)
MELNLVNALVTIAFGAVAGGVTNAVAIWMLFHPYTARGVGKLRLQGAIPKNKPRLAKTIGRTVGERLLTSEDLTSQLSAPGVREAFDDAVSGFVVALLEKERGALRQELPPGLLREVEGIIKTLAPAIADYLAEYAQTEGFREAIVSFQERLTGELGTRPLSEFLTAERRGSIRNRVEGWVAEAVTSDDLEDAIRQWLDKQVTKWEADHTPLMDRLPMPLVAAVEKQIASYLPMAIDRIVDVLGDPTSRSRIQDSLHRLFEGFVKNLLLHERIVARLVVTERTIARLLDNVERDGVEQVTRLLEEPEMRNQVARSVNDAVVNFLRKPLAEHMSALGAERVEGLKSTIQENIVAALRDQATRSFAIGRVDRAIKEAAEARTVGEILGHIPADDAAEFAASAVASERVRGWIIEGSSHALTSVLDRPIGRPTDRLPEGSIHRIARALSPAIWSWIQEQVPRIVGKLDIQTMVEEKVMTFSLERIEQIVRNTTQKELDLIIKLGYALGAVVGAVAYLVSVVLA